MSTREQIERIFNSITSDDLELMEDSISSSMNKHRGDIAFLESLTYDEDEWRGRVGAEGYESYDLSNKEDFEELRDLKKRLAQIEITELEAIDQELKPMFSLHSDLSIEMKDESNSIKEKFSKDGSIISTKQKVREVFSSINSNSLHVLRKAIDHAIEVYTFYCPNYEEFDKKLAQRYLDSKPREEYTDMDNLLVASLFCGFYEKLKCLYELQAKFKPLFELIEDYEEDQM